MGVLGEKIFAWEPGFAMNSVNLDMNEPRQRSSLMEALNET